VIAALVSWRARGSDAAATLAEAARNHASARFAQGVGIDGVARDYARLRRWLRAEAVDVDDAIDAAIAHAMLRYVERREEICDRFVGVVMHGLRTPLWSIAMAAELLQDETHADRQHVLLERIRASAARLHRMASELTLVREAMSDDIPVSRSVQDLGAIVEDVVAEARTIHGDHAITVELDGDLHAEVDPDRAHQAIANLVRNAVLRGADAIDVRVTASEDGRELVLAIRNRGKLATPPVVPSETDHGLGLYIVHQIARAHGATLEVASDADGARFTMSWPRRS